MVTQLLDDENISYKFLSPYSPDLNPIEKMWSKMKAFLRKQKVRAVDKLSDAINDALKTISVSDCIGWFHSCGDICSNLWICYKQSDFFYFSIFFCFQVG